MTGVTVPQASLVDAIPRVLNTTERGRRFPSPQLFQRVQRVDSATQEMWNGTSWVTEYYNGVNNMGPGAWINAKEPAYGGTADGVANDTAAASAAFTVALALQRPLYLGRGSWKIDDGTLTSSASGVKIFGDGRNCTIIQSSATGIMMQLTGAGVELRGLHLNGNANVNRAVYVASGGDGFKMRDCRIEGFAGVPLEFGPDAGANCSVSGSEILPGSPGGTSVKIAGTDTTAMARRFSDCTFGNGLFVNNSSNDTFFHNCFGRNLSSTGPSLLGPHYVGSKFGSLGGATNVTGTNTVIGLCTIAGDVTLDASFDHSTYIGNQDVSLTPHATALTPAAGNVIISRHLVAVPSADCIFGGGYKETISGFNQDNVSASQTDVELARADGRWRAVTSGSILGVIASLSAGQVWTAGTLTVEVMKSTINTTTGARTDVATGLTAVLNTSNRAFKITTQAKDTDTFAAGDELWAKVTTDGSWTPTSADLRVSIQVEC